MPKPIFCENVVFARYIVWLLSIYTKNGMVRIHILLGFILTTFIFNLARLGVVWVLLEIHWACHVIIDSEMDNGILCTHMKYN